MSNADKVSSPAAIAGELVIYGTQDGLVTALDASTGEVAWLYHARDKVVGRPLFHDGRLYIGTNDKEVHALDVSTGKLLMKFEAIGAVRGGIAVSGDRIYFGTYDGFIAPNK